MMRSSTITAIILALALGAPAGLTLSGCESNDDRNEGTFEDAGEDVDEGLEEAGEETEEVFDEIGDETEEVGEDLEDVGDEMEDVVD